MMSRILTAAALALILTAGVARAAQPISLHASTAGELAALCGAPPREPGADARINFCHGFAQGALDVERKRAEEAKLFCFPAQPPSRDVVMGEFVNWVRALPDHGTQSAVNGLFHFFGERFPCK